MIRFIYDMDGTLVDTRKAIRMAYMRAGIKVPADAWGKTWRDWGCPEDVHKEKARLYPNFVREYGRILPAASLLALTGGRVLTGASLEAVTAVKEVLKINFDLLGAECSDNEKMRLLRVECMRTVRDAQFTDTSAHRVALVDDRLEFGQRFIEELAGFEPLFFHVTENDHVYHVYDAQHPRLAQRWTLSPWVRFGA